MKYLSVLALAGLLPAVSLALPLYEREWVTRYNTRTVWDQPVYAFDVEVDADGNCYQALADGAEMAIIKVDPDGSFLWKWRSAPTDATHTATYVQDLRLMDDGTIMVAGLAQDPNGGGAWSSEEQLVARVNTVTGTGVWSYAAVMPNTFTGSTLPVICEDGTTYFTRNIKITNINWDASLVRVNSSGVKEWEKTVARPGENRGVIAADESANVYLCLGSTDSTWSELIKIDSAGNTVWETPFSQVDYGSTVQVSGSDVFVAGHYVHDTGNISWFVRKFNTNGTSVWRNTFDKTMGDRPQQILPDGVGGCIVGGHTNGVPTKADIALVRFNAAGGKMWDYGLTSAPGGGQDELGDIAWDPHGFLIAAGRLQDINDSSLQNGLLITLKIEPMTGTVIWQDSWREPEPPSDMENVFARGLSIRDNGDIHVSALEQSAHIGGVLLKIVQAPESLGDLLSARANTQLQLSADKGVLANDRYSGDSQLVLVDQPAHGTLTLNQDGSLLYKPATGYSGDDSFSYKLQKDDLASGAAPVAVRVQPNLTSLVLSPTSVTGGAKSEATVTASGPAPTGGSTLQVTDNTTVIATPPTAQIQAGLTSVKFEVDTSPVSSEVTRTVSVSLSGITRSASLRLLPAALKALVIQGSIVGGNTATGRVELTGMAAGLGLQIGLADNTSAITVPSSVTVANGRTQANFTVGTTGVTASVTRQVTATHASVSRVVNVTLLPAGLLSLSMSPSSVVGGANSTGTVKLNGHAAGAGINVALSDNTSAITTPASTVVAAGQSQKTFTVTTTKVTATSTRQVSATYAGVTKTANLMLTP